MDRGTEVGAGPWRRPRATATATRDARWPWSPTGMAYRAFRTGGTCDLGKQVDFRTGSLPRPAEVKQGRPLASILSSETSYAPLRRPPARPGAEVTLRVHVGAGGHRSRPPGFARIDRSEPGFEAKAELQGAPAHAGGTPAGTPLANDLAGTTAASAAAPLIPMFCFCLFPPT